MVCRSKLSTTANSFFALAAAMVLYSSHDGKQGVERETGEIKDCALCPYNQFGSDDKGKACKNVHRVFILREEVEVVYYCQFVFCFSFCHGVISSFYLCARHCV